MDFKEYPSYKDSGVEWLGKVPEHWGVSKFKYYYNSAMGETILKEDLKDDGVLPVYSATENTDFFGAVNSSSVILDIGDLVIPARGSIGSVKLVSCRSTCTQTTIYAKKYKKIEDKFVFYFSVGCRLNLFQYSKTAIPQITVNQVKNNTLLLPVLNEQSQIVSFLDPELQ